MALDALCTSEWSQAREILGDRLGSTRQLGARRLNLFLLSVAAASAGQQDVAETLLQQAHQTAKELGEPRHLGTKADGPEARERLRLLQLGWWDFNGWPVTESEEPSPTENAELCWESVVEGALNGHGQELDQRYTKRLAAPADSSTRYLWNFVALGYLEAGDLRTYEEMTKSAPAHVLDSLPKDLQEALWSRQLGHLVGLLEDGQWLTANHLQLAESPGTAHRAPIADHNWEAEMEAAFEVLAQGDHEAAARMFGSLTRQTLNSAQEAFALNGLALCLFRGGDYSSAEQTMVEFRTVSHGAEVPPGLAARYRIWLNSVEEETVADSAFCDPFSQGSESVPSEVSKSEGPSFWESYKKAVEELSQGHHNGCKKSLRGVLSSPVLEDRTLNFLTTMLWAGCSLLEGDHMAAQESLNTLSELFAEGPLDDSLLKRGGELFAEVGATTIHQKLTDPAAGGLDLWTDFPADFASDAL